MHPSVRLCQHMYSLSRLLRTTTAEAQGALQGAECAALTCHQQSTCSGTVQRIVPCLPGLARDTAGFKEWIDRTKVIPGDAAQRDRQHHLSDSPVLCALQSREQLALRTRLHAAFRCHPLNCVHHRGHAGAWEGRHACGLEQLRTASRATQQKAALLVAHSQKRAEIHVR